MNTPTLPPGLKGSGGKVVAGGGVAGVSLVAIIWLIMQNASGITSNAAEVKHLQEDRQEHKQTMKEVTKAINRVDRRVVRICAKLDLECAR